MYNQYVNSTSPASIQFVQFVVIPVTHDVESRMDYDAVRDLMNFLYGKGM